MPCRAASPGGWMEGLEGRQMLWAPLCGPPSIPGPTTPPPIVRPVPSTPTFAPLPWPLPAEPFTPRPPYTPPPVSTPPVDTGLIGTYTGPFGSLIGADSGIFTIKISGVSGGSYDAWFTYNGAGRQLSVPAKLFMKADGSFSMKYVSPKVVVQVTGKVQSGNGRITGEFQVWEKDTTYRAAFTLTRGAGRI
ncbi:MAG: hypothetical protein ACAI43_03180 [Phycisphaerae bacterium]|nr:hypothetical protein [Tepidisphaeraceae bacterium]